MATRRSSSRTKPARKPAARKSASKVPGISRIDQPTTRTFGWFCRYGYRPTPKGTRPKFTAFFGDATHGGKKKALDAATGWLKQVQRTGRPPKKD
ncbi:MAG: hypothetical protein ABI647_01965 [Gemmatimonadota bacterium]